MSEVIMLAEKAREAAGRLAITSSGQRNRALLAMSHALTHHQESILEANTRDMDDARAKNVGASLLDRLELNPARLKSMSEALRALSLLPDPVGEVVEGYTMPNGIRLSKIRVPLGVVGMIYEARPNVTADAAGLCIKTGNAVVLRGGSLSVNSNITLANVLSNAATAAGMPEGCIQ
ncbi:MAG: aldehyde dehydrogenase family protein, partial [Coriobacteriia bacterium]|nr:aldehyde dehydrogenase family protein [Coriobacteriia bacterium]